MIASRGQNFLPLAWVSSVTQIFSARALPPAVVSASHRSRNHPAAASPFAASSRPLMRLCCDAAVFRL